MHAKSFKHQIVASAEDIDHLGHVNNVVYVRWVQEVASAHWDSVAPEVLKRKYAWVVLRHEIDYKSPAFVDDTIIGETWVGEHHGARFERFVRLVLQKDQTIIAEAKTTWCMVDSKTFRPLRIGQEILNLL
jgi:acyl-CoA thioester hydrolase